MFHLSTGCDTTSCFFGKGKKSTWDAWKSFPDVTEAFKFLQDHPYYQMDKDDSIFKLLERFIVVPYDQQFDQCKWSPQRNFHQKEQDPREDASHTGKLSSRIFTCKE